MAENQVKQSEKRLSARAKFSKMLRVRPSEPKETHFEDLPISVNVSKHGIYFQSNRSGYHKGMRLFVTFPFTFANDPTNCEYLAEVVRVESLTNGRVGVGIRLLMTV
jgi:PilZ domain